MLVGSCLVCSALVGSCLVCPALVVSGPVCSALVGSGLVCSTLVGSGPVCSALVLCRLCLGSWSRHFLPHGPVHGLPLVRTRDVFLSSRTCLGLVGIWTRTWSLDSPNVLVGLDRVQQYMLFFLFQNKTINLARLFRKCVM